MRPIVLLPLLLALAAPLLHAAETPASIKASACQETDRMNDWREITCKVPAGEKARRYRFKATFTGGHDDTSASIAPELNDRPFQCDDGSKLSLFGEDGVVSVHCQFTARPRRARRRS